MINRSVMLGLRLFNRNRSLHNRTYRINEQADEADRNDTITFLHSFPGRDFIYKKKKTII